MKHFDIGGKDEWRFPQGGKPQAGYDLVRTAEDWDALWQGKPPGPLPAGAMAIVVHMGARSEGPWSIAVSALREYDDFLALDVEQRGPAGAVMRAPFSPYAVKLVEASDKEIEINFTVPPDRNRHLRPGAGPRPAI